MPTIRSLAKLAGVSKATVSLALHNSPRIRQSECVRIQKLAAEVGYRPNALMAHLLAQLRSGKSPAYQSALGLVYATRSMADLEIITTFREWFAACKARCKQLGYSLDEFMLHDTGMSPKRLIQVLDARNIRGLVVMGPFDQSVIPAEFDAIWRRSAAVAIGMRPTRPALSCAANDQFSTAREAVNVVRGLGYRRPGLCINLEVDAHVENRFQGGFSVAQRGLPDKHRLPVCDFQPFGQEHFTSWLERYRPDAILTLHPEIKDWVEAAGIKVPDDVGLVHLDRVHELQGWAGMRQKQESVGYAAIDMVIGQLHRNEIGLPPFQKCTFTNSTWVDGTTVRKLTDPARNPTRKTKRPVVRESEIG